MARADTFQMEKITGYFDQKECAICGEKATHRAFYYPTYMNGDAEWLGDYCKAHAGTSLSAVCHGKVEIRYPLPEFPKAKIKNQ